MATCTYQLATRADAPTIASLSRVLIELGLQPSWPTHRVLWHMRDRDSIVLSAKARNTLVGFAIMQFGETTAHLHLLGTVPSQQRRGIGRGMLTWLEATAMTAGTFLIELEVRASNPAGRAFYSALGYREAGLIEGYYQGRDTAVRMARVLGVKYTALDS